MVKLTTRFLLFITYIALTINYILYINISPCPRGAYNLGFLSCMHIQTHPKANLERSQETYHKVLECGWKPIQAQGDMMQIVSYSWFKMGTLMLPFTSVNLKVTVLPLHLIGISWIGKTEWPLKDYLEQTRLLGWLMATAVCWFFRQASVHFIWPNPLYSWWLLFLPLWWMAKLSKNIDKFVRTGFYVNVYIGCNYYWRWLQFKVSLIFKTFTFSMMGLH